MSKKKDYEPDDKQIQSFTAYIVKGNRQVVNREVKASKRFRVEENTYIIKPECIFLKNIDGKLQSVSYYREGNPNPYDFENINTGIESTDLDRFYAEDFYNIIVNIQPDNRAVYIFLFVIFNFILCLLFVIGVGISEFIL